MATGHYIQRKDGENGPELHAAADANRDQSYFLFSTTAEQLDYLPSSPQGLEDLAEAVESSGMPDAGAFSIAELTALAAEVANGPPSPPKLPITLPVLPPFWLMSKPAQSQPQSISTGPLN